MAIEISFKTPFQPDKAPIAVPTRSGRATLEFDDPRFDGFPYPMAVMRFGDDPHGPSAAMFNFAPNIRFVPHFHSTDQCFVVMEGSIRVGRTWYGPGTVRCQDGGAVYGPLLVGPQGCKAICFYGDRASMSDEFASERDRERYWENRAMLAALVASGATSVASAASVG